MTWPTNPETLADIPGAETALAAADPAIDMNAVGIDALCRLAQTYHGMLERITQGDPGREVAFGGELALAVARGANMHMGEAAETLGTSVDPALVERLKEITGDTPNAVVVAETLIRTGLRYGCFASARQGAPS